MTRDALRLVGREDWSILHDVDNAYADTTNAVDAANKRLASTAHQRSDALTQAG